MHIPIKIQIKDNKKYGDVCFLLDSDDFCTESNSIRQKLGLQERFQGTLSEWKLRHSTDESQKRFDRLFYHIGDLSEEELKKELTSLSPDSNYLESIAMDGVLQMGLSIEIEKLHDLFAFPDLLNNVVYASMLCDTVSEADYSLARLDFFDTSSNPNSQKNRRRPYFGIEITPWTRMSDIEIAFKEIKKYKLDYCAFYGQFNFHLDKDSISNIKRDRDWYWRNMNGESYLDIANSESIRNGLEPDDIKSGIAKAISQYKKRLIRQHSRMV